MSSLTFLLLILGFFCARVGSSPFAKRSNDPSPLVAVVAQLSSNLQSVQAQLSALTSKVDSNTAKVEQRIAFSVGLKTNILRNITKGMTIKFDNILTNAGNAYNPMDGHFVAPVSGIYVFYFKTEVTANEQLTLELFREGHTIARMYAGNSNTFTFETSGDLEVVHLGKGERLWVVKSGGSTRYLPGFHGTRFSGFLLRAD